VIFPLTDFQHITTSPGVLVSRHQPIPGVSRVLVSCAVLLRAWLVRQVVLPAGGPILVGTAHQLLPLLSSRAKREQRLVPAADEGDTNHLLDLKIVTLAACRSCIRCEGMVV
jgi:hypothetical protein